METTKDARFLRAAAEGDGDIVKWTLVSGGTKTPIAVAAAAGVYKSCSCDGDHIGNPVLCYSTRPPKKALLTIWGNTQ